MIDSITQYILNEGYLLSDKTISVNLHEFESGKNKKLLIIGNSGSGKTTIGMMYEKKYKYRLWRTDDDFKNEQGIRDVIKGTKPAIIEGIDLAVLYVHDTKNLMLSKPMIILGMSAIRAGLRSGRRNINIGMGYKQPGVLVKLNVKYIEKNLKLLRSDVSKLPNAVIKKYDIPDLTKEFYR